MKKPDCRTRAAVAFARALGANDRRTKSPTADTRAFEGATRQMQRDNPDDLFAQLIPTDLTEVSIVADYCWAMLRPRHFAYMADRRGMTVKEVARERDRALERLENRTHKLRLEQGAQ